MDIPLLMMAFGANLSFVAGEFILNLPLYGVMTKRLGCVFVPRAGSPEQLAKVLSMVTDRQ